VLPGEQVWLTLQNCQVVVRRDVPVGREWHVRVTNPTGEHLIETITVENRTKQIADGVTAILSGVIDGPYSGRTGAKESIGRPAAGKSETIDYLKFTGRKPEQVALVEAYAKEQGMWDEGGMADPALEREPLQAQRAIRHRLDRAVVGDPEADRRGHHRVCTRRWVRARAVL
jgi:hypothetical protein